MTDFEHSRGTEALHAFCSLCRGTSATAYSAAIKDQWTVHILYWFVCWISEWIFRCIYNGLIKAPFDLKNTTITESSVLFATEINCSKNVNINWSFSGEFNYFKPVYFQWKLYLWVKSYASCPLRSHKIKKMSQRLMLVFIYELTNPSTSHTNIFSVIISFLGWWMW